LQAILAKVVSPRAEVTRLLPPGVSPHTYDPRPSDARATETALALAYVSPELDAWAANLPTRQRLELLSFLPKTFRLPAVEADKKRGNANGDLNQIDPHFWLDPLSVKAILPDLTKRFCDIDPGGKKTYEENADRFSKELSALNDELSRTLAPVKGHAVVLVHPSMRYFLKRYGLKVAGYIEPLPGKEPSPRYLTALINRVKSEHVKAVFTEPQLSDKAAKTVADAAGINVFELDPIGGVAGRVGYAALLRYNARILLKALQ